MFPYLVFASRQLAKVAFIGQALLIELPFKVIGPFGVLLSLATLPLATSAILARNRTRTVS